MCMHKKVKGGKKICPTKNTGIKFAFYVLYFCYQSYSTLWLLKGDKIEATIGGKKL